MPYMSLTYEIRRTGSPVHGFFHDRFPNVAPMIAEFETRLVAATTLYPPKRTVEPPYATIGGHRLSLDVLLLGRSSRGLEGVKGARWSPGVGDPHDSVAVAIHDAGSQYGTTSISRLVYDFFMSLERPSSAEIRPVRRQTGYDQETRLCRYCFVLGLFLKRDNGV